MVNYGTIGGGVWGALSGEFWRASGFRKPRMQPEMEQIGSVTIGVCLLHLLIARHVTRTVLPRNG